MDILFVTAEVAPLAKTGGLGDVCAALPRHLKEAGHDVRIVLPLYRRIRLSDRPLTAVPGMSDVSFPVGPNTFRFSLYQTPLPGTDVPVYLVDIPGLYDRPGIYGDAPDEHLRFIALTYASLILCQHLAFAPDVIHVHDWPTALLPLVLKTHFAWDEAIFGRTKTVLTIHNLAHQGVFGTDVLGDTGLGEAPHLFHQEQMRDHGIFGFLMTGILYATAVTTVSPTYAREIQTDDQGLGLGATLRSRSGSVVGILNGIDEHEWSPERDPHIRARYSRDTLDDKRSNKKALLASLGLEHGDRLPVVGVVTRLVWQKGLELILEALPPYLAKGWLQLVVLGSGAADYEHAFIDLQHRFPHHVCFYRGFNEPLAHMIEAGADMFLMPSRFEPCGLNQMYSLRYGTAPIVRQTGGLADTVRHFDRRTRRGNGFVFRNFDATGLRWALDEALATWSDPAAWRELQRQAMSEDNSWSRRVATYETLYRRLPALEG